MLIRIRNTGAVMTEQEFRRLHPNTSFPQQITVEMLAAYDADPVLNGPQPTTTRYQVAAQDGVELLDGQWFTKFIAVDMDEEAKQALDSQQSKAVREDRNKRLSDCDWTQGKDIPDNISIPWAAYRQALRDIPAQPGFPWSVEWPTQPE
jgi:hypothetical protein